MLIQTLQLRQPCAPTFNRTSVELKYVSTRAVTTAISYDL